MMGVLDHFGATKAHYGILGAADCLSRRRDVGAHARGWVTAFATLV